MSSLPSSVRRLARPLRALPLALAALLLQGLCACAHLPVLAPLSPRADAPSIEQLLAPQQATPLPTSMTLILLIDRGGEELVLIARTHRAADGTLAVAAWTELGVTVIQMTAQPGSEICILRNPLGLPVGFLRGGLWVDCTLLFPGASPAAGEIRSYADGSLALTTKEGASEWLFSGPPWQRIGKRGITGNRVLWSAEFPGNGWPPERLLVTHHDQSYSNSITVQL